MHTDRKSCPSPHGFGNKVARLLWGCVWVLLFRPSPVPFRAWRRCLLRCFGAKIGTGVKVMPSAKIWAPWNLTMGEQATIGEGVNCYCVAPIEIAAHATVSQGAHLCAASHDIEDPRMKLIRAPIQIQTGAWICAEAFVGMGVVVEEGAVVGARAVVVKDVSAWDVVVGNPATFLKKRELRDR